MLSIQDDGASASGVSWNQQKDAPLGRCILLEGEGWFIERLRHELATAFHSCAHAADATEPASAFANAIKAFDGSPFLRHNLETLVHHEASNGDMGCPSAWRRVKRRRLHIACLCEDGTTVIGVFAGIHHAIEFVYRVNEDLGIYTHESCQFFEAVGAE